MHGLTGGSWKRSPKPPRQLPTLLTVPLGDLHYKIQLMRIQRVV